jgi:preprotein translocase subunit SecG
MLRIALTIIQVFSAIAIMALVLLQRGKGADAGAGFGAGASGTVFGARGARTALSRATAIFAAVFMLNSLALVYMGTRAPTERPKTILDQAAETNTAPSSGTNAPAPAVQTPAPAPAAPTSAPEGAPPQSGTPAPATNTPSPTPQQ